MRAIHMVSGTLVVLGALAGCRDQRAASSAEPSPAAAAAVGDASAKAREAEAAAREAARLAALWSYHDVAAGTGRQLTASIYSVDDVDTGGRNPARVRLVFRDHPSWGRSSYLVLQGGDFNCYGGCTASVTADDGQPARMAGRRPKTDDAIAMFINDARALWRMTSGAARLAIEFPVAAGGARSAVFEVSGLDRSKLPGWDPAR